MATTRQPRYYADKFDEDGKFYVFDRLGATGGVADSQVGGTEAFDTLKEARAFADGMNLMDKTPAQRWEDAPEQYRMQVTDGVSMMEQYARDYASTVKDKEVADRFNPDDPKAWSKTVEALFTYTFLFGHMVGGASTMGFPQASELFERYAAGNSVEARA